MRTAPRTIGPLIALAAGLAACAAPDSGQDLLERDHQSNAGLDWRDQIIYQIVVDRFSNGDSNNDYNVEPGTPGRYHGGDWQGVIDRLDYLEELGVTALWISPVVRNVEEDAGFASYHGYWTQDPLRVNPHFGDIHKLRELVDEAHRRGMLMILDVIVNHTGQLFYYDINGNGQPDIGASGGGQNHTCVQICDNPARASECSDDERVYCDQGRDYFEQISEYEPEYDPRGVQGWTSGGFSGPADIRFFRDPGTNHMLPPRPPDWFGWPGDKPWFDHPSWYSRRGRVYVWWHEDSYSRDFVREQEIQGDFVAGLRDLATDNPDVREALIRSVEYWISAADFDGLRVDTLKHMDRPEVAPNRRDFVAEFSTRWRAHAARVGKQNLFIFGEAFDGNEELIGAYTFGGEDADGAFGRVDAVLSFNQKFRVFDQVFKAGGPTRNIECSLLGRLGQTPDDSWCADHGFPAGPTFGDRAHAERQQGGIGLAPQQVAVGFLDNHDLERFAFEEPDLSALRAALFFLLTWDGIPSIYYGTEQDFAGGSDPKNREDMIFASRGETFALLAQLIALRKEHVALRRGDVTVRWATDRPRGADDSGIFAFERNHPDQRVLVVVNTAADQASRTCAPEADGGVCMQVGFAPGTVLRDVGPWATGEPFAVGADGRLELELPPRTGAILVE